MVKKKVFNKTAITIILVLIVLAILGVLKFQAEIFDVFGILVFSFLVFVSGWMLYSHKETPNWVAWILLGIGIMGIIIDGGIVLKVMLG